MIENSHFFSRFFTFPKQQLHTLAQLYIVSFCPLVEFVLLKTLNRLLTFLSLPLVSYMKLNRYSTVLDWKLEAVSTRIYWFLPFSTVPSILTARTLQLSLGFIHHRGCSCTLLPQLCSGRRTKAGAFHSLVSFLQLIFSIARVKAAGADEWICLEI